MAGVRTATLATKTNGGVTLLDALSGPQGVRLSFASSSLAPDAFSVTGAEVKARETLLGAVTLKLGQVDGPLRVAAGGGEIVAKPTPAETNRFEGLAVGMACRMFESAELTRDWLLWHRDHHAMDAALIIDRAQHPGFAAELADAVADEDGMELLVLRPGVPVGKAGLGPEADLYYAPDAPGRDRMAEPAEDPWRAPLGEITLFEVLRHRFLASARAVMNLDLSDLLAPPGDQTVFDRAEAVSGGVVPLAGRHAYPWRLPQDRPTHYGDHICRMFDRNAVRWRWCVAPGQTGPETTWRLLRVTGARARRGDTMAFWRCMALRHPGQRAAALAPKSSLVHDPAQVAALEARFGVLAEPLPELALTEPANPGTITLVTTVKNEAPFIVDWLAWHRAMGADHFVIYSNDCTDGTEELLVALDAAGVITHRNNDGYGKTGRTPQHSVLAAADEDPIVQSADWILFADVDEYVNVKVGEGQFADLFAAMPDANMISMTWRLFGNSDVDAFEDRPVFEQFRLCAPEICRKPHQAWGFKTLFRNQGVFRKLGVHRPKGLNPQLADHIRWMNGSGRPMPITIYRNGWRSTQATYGYDIVQLNHYAVRSAESFLVKRERGRANHVSRDQGLLYWFRMNNNAQPGGVNPAMLPAFAAERARLMALPDIAAAHGGGVRRHRAKIAALQEDPVYAAFFEILTSDRMRRLSRLLGHFGAGVFHAGPDAVPDAKVFGEWAEGEFFTVPLVEAAE